MEVPLFVVVSIEETLFPCEIWSWKLKEVLFRNEGYEMIIVNKFFDEWDDNKITKENDFLRIWTRDDRVIGVWIE